MSDDTFFASDERFARVNVSLEFARHPTEGHVMAYYRISDPDNAMRSMGPVAMNIHQPNVRYAMEEILREAARAVMYQLPTIEELAAPSDPHQTVGTPLPGR